ncbi:tetratricopeptide repeat protein [Myxococcota bacterium]|nr:tetratricopeptide repeat protein [Myxococcota bacterium]
MATRKETNTAAETLAELEATGDRLAEWTSEHAKKILAVLFAVLVAAAIVGFYFQHRAEGRKAAANALALATSEYRQAMGADPMGGAIPEPANPEVGRSTRTKFSERFATLAAEHPKTTSGALAWLEAGQISTELGQVDEAKLRFEKARDAAAGTAIGALAWIRLAELAEDAKDLAAAAGAYESAAGIAAYPLRANALADAARCWIGAGETAKGLAVYQRLESEFPDQHVSPQVEALVEELRAKG